MNNIVHLFQNAKLLNENNLLHEHVHEHEIVTT